MTPSQKLTPDKLSPASVRQSQKSRRAFIKTITAGTACLLSNALPTAAAQQSSANNVPSQRTSSNRILFVDRQHMTAMNGVRLKLHQPVKTGERILESERPWENATLNWFSIIEDQGRYRMWYECYDVDGWPTADDTSLCYAESEDGIHWKRPDLGLFPWRGNTQNNIVFRQIGDGSSRSRVHGSCIFVDPIAPADQRYKCVSQGIFQDRGDRPHSIAGMVSPDGLHWTRLPKPICPVFADSQYSAFRDEHQKLVIFGRVSGRGGRAIGRSVSNDFDSFAPLTRVLETSCDDPLDCDLYNPACLSYPGTKGLYLMFPSLFRHREDTLEIRLAVSRDGIQWTWPEREKAFLPVGDPGNFDGGSLYMANGGCVVTGEEMWFYFSGSNLRHEEVDLPKLANPANRRVFSRAVLRRDRLVSATADRDPGRFETPPVLLTGRQLLLNAETREAGSVRVGLLDENGQEIPGRGVKDCVPFSGNMLSTAVQWNGGSGFSEWSGQHVRLLVELQHADLFSLQFAETGSA